MPGCSYAFLSGVIVLAVSTPTWAEPADTQFPAPPNSLSFEDTGTLEGFQDGYLQIRDSKTDLWILKVAPETKILVEGEAETDYLHPGLSIQFTGELDKKGMLAKAIDAIEIVHAPGKQALGLFAAGDDDPDARPVRNPTPGSYRIRGKLAAFRNGALTVAIGSRRLAGTLADKVAIKIACDDPSIAQVGDAVKVKAWYYGDSKPIPALNRAGRALAEEITITLAKPLAPTGKRARPTERPVKAPTKNVKAER